MQLECREGVITWVHAAHCSLSGVVDALRESVGGGRRPDGEECGAARIDGGGGGSGKGVLVGAAGAPTEEADAAAGPLSALMTAAARSGESDPAPPLSQLQRPRAQPGTARARGIQPHSALHCVFPCMSRRKDLVAKCAVLFSQSDGARELTQRHMQVAFIPIGHIYFCLLYTSPSPRD